MTHVRRIVQLAAVSLVINFTFATPHGQTAPPSLKLFTNQAVFGAGSTLEVTIGVQHAGAPAVVDLLFGAILPDGDTVAFFEGPGLSPAFGRLSQIASIRPTYPAVPINAGLTMTPDFFRYTFTGGEPLGQYQLFFAATPPNALRDGRIDAGDLIALQLAPIRLAPPASITVDVARSGSGLVSRTGGTVNAVGADGTQYTLSVPAGALLAPTTITLIPVAAMSGLAGSLQAVRAVRAEPDGLTFAVPARLTIRPPAGGPARLVGMATANGGSGLQLLAAARTNTGEIVIPNVAHFSVVGVAVPSSTVELEAFFATSDFVSRVIDAHFSGGPEQALMEQWFDTEIRPLLQSGQTNNTALFKGIAQVFSWETNRTTAGSASDHLRRAHRSSSCRKPHSHCQRPARRHSSAQRTLHHRAQLKSRRRSHAVSGLGDVNLGHHHIRGGRSELYADSIPYT